MPHQIPMGHQPPVAPAYRIPCRMFAGTGQYELQVLKPFKSWEFSRAGDLYNHLISRWHANICLCFSFDDQASIMTFMRIAPLNDIQTVLLGLDNPAGIKYPMFIENRSVPEADIYTKILGDVEASVRATPGFVITPKE